jgi:hypothetical protein
MTKRKEEEEVEGAVPNNSQVELHMLTAFLLSSGSQ